MIEKFQIEVVDPADEDSRDKAIEALEGTIEALIKDPSHRAVTLEVEAEDGRVILTVHPHVVHKPAPVAPKLALPGRKVILNP